MSTTYAKSQTIAQKKDAPTAASVLDASSQSESLQRKADMANNAAQRAEAPRPNNTGMPDNLKSGIESLSGFSMDDVRVHYNSSKPATVQALAYTQGTDIHVAPGQEKHLPHEAWHVAQQMAGRVSPTTNINGMPVNDNAGLEHEADVMGKKAVQCKMFGVNFTNDSAQCSSVQRMAFYNPDSPSETTQIEGDAETAEIFNREVGKERRNRELAGYVDQFKKEMLTYIACCIQEKGIKNEEHIDYGPHISVVITGGKWYIAINSDYVKNIEEKGFNPQDMLLADAQSVQLDISEKWGKIHEWFVTQKTTDASSLMFSSDPSGEFAKKQALYIVYRWAGKNKGVVVEQNQKKDEGVIHGEMETLDYLQKKEPEWKLNFFIRFLRNHITEFDEESKKNELQGKSDEVAIAYLSSLTLVSEEEITNCLNFELRNRVIRVGGTKTACLDCHYEMGGRNENANGALIVDNGKSGKEFVSANCLIDNCEVGTNGNPSLEEGRPKIKGRVHRDTPSKNVINDRHVVTMTQEHGMGYKGWIHPNERALEMRTTGYHNRDDDEFEEQDQDYDELFITAESVLPEDNRMSIPEPIICLWEKRKKDLELLQEHHEILTKSLISEEILTQSLISEDERCEALIQSFEKLEEMKNEYIEAFVVLLKKQVKDKQLNDIRLGLQNFVIYERKLISKLTKEIEIQKEAARTFFEEKRDTINNPDSYKELYKKLHKFKKNVKEAIRLWNRLLTIKYNILPKKEKSKSSAEPEAKKSNLDTAAVPLVDKETFFSHLKNLNRLMNKTAINRCIDTAEFILKNVNALNMVEQLGTFVNSNLKDGYTALAYFVGINGIPDIQNLLTMMGICERLCTIYDTRNIDVTPPKDFNNTVPDISFLTRLAGLTLDSSEDEIVN